MLMLMITLIMMITHILIFISILISKKKKFDREKNSPFECGFDPKTPSRLPFSLQFFIITIIFLIFDVEISIILPMIISFKLINNMIWFITSISIMIILIIGIFYEWNQSLLNWKF
uniref:NADH-ubiquinone oxidoreductase chain 3 n=1 Tax=Hydropsyche pellucidula TaxID=869943 RepID=A0A0U3E2V9_9NEOP|nr:NADH dehydrogenase subunit 3 [Hydropsyche pellucidula]ALT58527.1 NADH dehydrogenase subunit 3 [Hydropsyche pellucidula]